MPENEVSYEDLRKLVTDGYVPFANIERAIPWPGEVEYRYENDAEHSFSIAFAAAAVASNLGLDSGKAAEFGLVHDYLERYTGDISLWDDSGRANKKANEELAFEQLRGDYAHLPWLPKTIEDYESLESEEARLVYALDKLLPTIMIVETRGYFWKSKGITFDQHLAKVEEVRPKIAKHHVILGFYDELLDFISANQDKFFAPNSD